MVKRLLGSREGTIKFTNALKKTYKIPYLFGDDHYPTSFLFLFQYLHKMTVTKERVLNINNINPLIKNVEYAVRGKLAIRAEEIRTDLEKGQGKYAFDKVVSCNIGNPQQLNQAPITFFRQVK